MLAQPARPVETQAVSQLSLGRPAFDQNLLATRLPLALHSDDVDVQADRIAAMQAEARAANEKYDVFDPVSLRRTRDLLIQLGRGAEALPLQRRILQFRIEGPEKLVELQILVKLCIEATQFKDAVDAIEKARLENQGQMNSEVRVELTVSAAFARLLDGDAEGAQCELDNLEPRHYDDHALMLRAMIKQARCDLAGVKAAIRDLRKPAHRVLLDLWCERPTDALAGLNAFVRVYVPPPGVALPEDVQKFAQTILLSPIVAASPFREVLTASDSWGRLRELCQPLRMAEIAVETRLPDLKPHVRAALTRMKLLDLAEIMAGMDVRTDDIFTLISSYYSKWNDPRINAGITFDEKGCTLLATHFNRELGTQISVHANLTTASAALVELIARATSTPGDANARNALILGAGHAVCVVYIREKKEEALFLFDSIAEFRETTSANIIQEALSRTGRTMPVYQQAFPTQSGRYGCFVQSMEAAVTLTRRVPGEPGNFLIPDLITELDAMRVAGAEPDPFIPTKALPEIAKMSQTPALLEEHFRDRADGRLRDSERGLSTKEFVREHIVRIEHRGANVDVYDYTRQEGLQDAQIIEIEAWNQAILARIGLRVWTPQQQNVFAARVKTRLRPLTESRSRAEPEAKR